LKALKISPSDAEIYNIAGDYYLIVRDLRKAIEMESKALDLDPLHAINHHDLGEAYAFANDWEDALKYAISAKNLNLEFWCNQ